ncbi:MAG: AAA family ATPase [Eubacterium sp.]|nr:AAA family ATPase [Eubacterium sp.]
MGIYLNPGFENYQDIIKSGLYVDKTLMIRETNRFIDRANKYICVSRPRRFGKTIAGNMLAAYYSKGCDSRELFSGLKIAGEPDFDRKLNRFNVIKIDMNSEYQNSMNKDKMLSRLTREIKKEIAAAYPTATLEDDDSLAQSMLRVYASTGETFIILIDEYDVIVREQVSRKIFDDYLSFLNGLFKSDTLRPAVSLAYLTGILPVVRDKIQSKLNNFEEYTIIDAENLAEYVGFTDYEVKAICRDYRMDFEECRRWYDGYRQHGYEIYNPESVVKSARKRIFGSYWGQTSSYQVISDRIIQNFEGIKESVIRMLAGENVDVDIHSYLNTMTDFTSKDDVFGYLLHLGYLAYNAEDHTCRIPNKEIREEWFRALKKIPEEYHVTSRIIQESKELLYKTWRGDEEAVARALDFSHIHVTSNRSYNNEDALGSAVYLSYIYALNHYTVIKEMTAGKGFADVVFVPLKKGDPAMIIELKRNDSAGKAIDQIRDKEYFHALDNFQGEILFAGINYDEKSKSHSCRIERFVK